MELSNTGFIVLLVFYVGISVIIAFLMQDTKLGFTKGLILSILYSPVVGLFIYLITPDKINYFDELEKLDKLKAKNKLTQEEYDISKERLMHKF